MMQNDKKVGPQRTIVLYTSKYGAAETYARWIAEALGCCAVPLDKFSKKELQGYVLRYAKTKDVRDGLKAQKSDKARAAYRQKHESDFIIADAAARYFREHGIKKLPTYKSLQAEIEQLTADKNARYNDYREKKERVRELQTVKGNIDQMMRGAPSQQKRHEHDR